MTEKLPCVSEFKFNKFKVLHNSNALRSPESTSLHGANPRRWMARIRGGRHRVVPADRQPPFQSFQPKSNRRNETVVMTTM